MQFDLPGSLKVTNGVSNCPPRLRSYWGWGALAAACTALLQYPNANAAEFDVVPGSESQPTLVTIEGDIIQGDDAKFRKIAAEHEDAIVMLDSEGGAIVPAMDIGRTIRLREYTTAVYKDSSCTSACALIWVAGTHRAIFDGGRVGFHASYQDIDGKLIETGMGNALVGHYLSQLGMGQKAVIFATAAPPDKILWLDAQTAPLSDIEFASIPASGAQTEDGSQQIGKPSPPPASSDARQKNRERVLNDSGTTTPAYKQWIAATNETVRNVDGFAQGLRQRGFQAEIDTDDSESPRIYTGIGGHKVVVSFSSCSGMNCDYAEIMSYWSEVNANVARKVTGAWATDENFSSAIYFQDSRSVVLYHYVLLGRDGITIPNLIENLEYFAKDFQRIGSLLAGGL